MSESGEWSSKSGASRRSTAARSARLKASTASRTRAPEVIGRRASERLRPGSPAGDLARQRPANGERVVEHGECPAADRSRVARDPQLAQDRVHVEVDPLADEPVLLEDEDRAEAHLEASPGRWQAPERTVVGAVEVGLDDHRIVRVVQGDQLVALVREGGAGLLEVGGDLSLAVVHLAGPDQP